MEWPKQLQHGVNEACEPPVLAGRQLEGCSATTSPRSKFMIERRKATFPGFFLLGLAPCVPRLPPPLPNPTLRALISDRRDTS